MGFSETIREVWSRVPDQESLEFEGRWLPWRCISATGQAIERVLHDAGVPRTAAVGLVARNRPGPIAALAGLLGFKRCVVMIYSAQSPDAISADIRHLNLAVVVADGIDWTPAAMAAAGSIGSLGVRVDVHPTSPAIAVEPVGALGGGPFREAETHVALELLSSGTTGPPKRTPLAATTFEQAAEDAVRIYGGSAEAPSTALVCHPISNIAGVTFLTPWLFCGQPTCVLERFELHRWLDAVRRHRPARGSLPPPLIKQVLDENIPAEDLASFEAIGVGAAKLDADLQAQFEDRYGLPLLVSYGATEFGGVAANWTPELHREFSSLKRASVGRARPGVALRIVDPETGEALTPGEQGLLEARLERLGPDWIRTTDLASIDVDGFLFLHGRADQAINRGGFKVLPETVAAAIRSHPDVREAAVVGLADERLGEIPAAGVELVPGSAIDAQDLIAHVRGSLLAYQVPAAVRIMAALPRNASMKVDLIALRRALEGGA